MAKAARRVTPNVASHRQMDHQRENVRGLIRFAMMLLAEGRFQQVEFAAQKANFRADVIGQRRARQDGQTADGDAVRAADHDGLQPVVQDRGGHRQASLPAIWP